MKKYYSTRSPEEARHILLDTSTEAIQEAKTRTASDGRTRYVVKILFKIEPDTPPVKVTKVE